METLSVLDNKEYVRTQRLPSFGKQTNKNLTGLHLAIDCIELSIHSL